jgi:hypothetical protein
LDSQLGGDSIDAPPGACSVKGENGLAGELGPTAGGPKCPYY